MPLIYHKHHKTTRGTTYLYHVDIAHKTFLQYQIYILLQDANHFWIVISTLQPDGIDQFSLCAPSMCENIITYEHYKDNRRIIFCTKKFIRVYSNGASITCDRRYS